MTAEVEEEASGGGSPVAAKSPEATSSRKHQSFTKQLAELNARDASDTAKEKADDRAFIHEMAKIFIKSTKHNVDSLRTDRDLLLRVVKEHKDGWRLLKHALPELRADRELLLAAVKGTSMGWKAMLNAPPELREDRDVCVEAVRRNAAALEILSPKLRKDQQLVSESLGAISRRMQAPKERAAAAEWNRMFNHTRSEVEQVHPRGLSFMDRVSKERGEGKAERLKNELQNGLGTVHKNEENQTVRTVMLMNLWICNPNGLVLAVLGRYDQGELEPKCMLPGKKIEEGHQPRDEVLLYMDTTFFRFKTHMRVDMDFDMHTEEARSNTFGLNTRYRKATFKGVAKPGLPWRQATAKICRFKSPHAAQSSPSLARRFARGQAAGASPPKPPDMYTLNNVEGRWQFNPEKVDIFAWIPVWEYQWLRGSELGRATLEDWLMDVDLPGHLTMLASGGFSSRSRSPSPSRAMTWSHCQSSRSQSSPRDPSGALGFDPSPVSRPGSSRGFIAGGAGSGPCRPRPLSQCSPCSGAGSPSGSPGGLLLAPDGLSSGHAPTPRAGGRQLRSPTQAPGTLPDALTERGALQGARGHRGG